MTDWNLGDDSVGTNARKALDAAGITPEAAAAMTAKQLAAIPGLGKTRVARVLEQLRAIADADVRTKWAATAAIARQERLDAIAAAKQQPGHCADCGGLRATEARSVVRDVWGHNRNANPRNTLRLDPCDGCHQHHGELVRERAAELAGAR
jgi:hypothetical protein